MKTGWLPGLALALIACGTATRTEPSGQGRAVGARQSVVVGELEGQVIQASNPSASSPGPLLFTVQLNPVKDGQTGSNPPNTIEVFSDVPLAAGTTCSPTNDVETSVTIANYLQEELRSLQVGMVDVTPTANKICTPLPANADPALITTWGVIDYSANNSIRVGAYDALRAPLQGGITTNGLRAVTWAFTNPNNGPFSWRARMVADLRPKPAFVGSPYVDALTPGTPSPAILVISDDPKALDNYSFPNPIVNSVTFSTFFDSGMATSAGDSGATAAIDQTNATYWGTGPGFTNATTTPNIGRTIYVQMQNVWLDSASGTVTGQVIPPGSDASKTFLVTNPATVPATGTNGSSGTVRFTLDSHAAGAEIEIFNSGRGGSCASPITRVSGPTVLVPATSPAPVPGYAGLAAGTYCYRIRNDFFAPYLNLNYPGSWSGYSDFTK
jgi:hypothetical protein